MDKLTQKVLALCLMAAALPSLAQENGQSHVVATLQINKGVVMTSRGGEYVPGATGQQLFSNDRLMVTQGGSATVVYNDNCRRTYSTPGVYAMDANCKGAVWFNGAGAAAGIAAGVIAIGVVAHNINDHGNNNQPISR